MKYLKIPKLLMLLFLISGCNYQEDIKLKTGIGAITGILISDDILDRVVLDNQKIDSDYLDSYLSEIVVPITDVVSGFPDTRVNYKKLENLYLQDKVFQSTRLKLYKFYRDIDLKLLSREQLHATYINAYNFFTLETVLLNYDNGSLKSISDIGGIGSFRAFKEIFYRLGGEKLSLDQIENEKLRPSMNYADGRVHFALICASIGCPVLSKQAYRSEILESQLDSVTRIGLRLPRILDMRNNKLKVSQIFDWFLDDFINQSGSVDAFLRTYSENLPDTLPAIEYIDYDWGLNEIR